MFAKKMIVRCETTAKTETAPNHDGSSVKKSRVLVTGIAVASVAAAMSVGVIATAATPSGAELEAPVRAVPPPTERPELPREWRWQRQAHSFDGMFRQK